MHLDLPNLSPADRHGRLTVLISKRTKRRRSINELATAVTSPLTKGQRVPKVALLIESARAAGRALLCGIAGYAHHNGPWSFYWETSGLESHSSSLDRLDVDGVIMRDTDRVEEVLARGLPVVVVGHRHREVAGVANVVTGSHAIGRMAAEHLMSCGVRHFAFCGYSNCCWSEIRYEAFKHVVSLARFDCAGLDIPTGDTGAPWQDQREAIADWLRQLPRPVGLMACNDDLGHEVIAAAKLAGLSVPDDVAVIGVDNDELVCGLTDPPLSSVAVNFERAGYEAAHVLAGLMKRSTAASRIIVNPTHIVPRRSTSLLAVEDICLAKALRFIRDRVQESPSVEAVSRAGGISRRALEKRFRDSLGRSVLDEIRRVRTDQIAQLLVETELPVAQIAERLGFADAQHIARYFRSAKAMSPLAYRKLHGRHQSIPGGA
jgi:LacI family transcriptional regulator, galactose operon repressor